MNRFSKRHTLIALLVIWLPLTAVAEGGKTTLESISLKALEGDDLAEAVITGSLDAPAAGESIEVPEALKENRKEALEPYDTREDFGRFNVPASYDLRPAPAEIGGRTYNYDYFFGTPR